MQTSSVPPGVFDHDISDDGLTLTSTFRGPLGTYTATMGWSDLPTAEAHYDIARELFEQDADQRAAELHDGTYMRMRRRRSRLGVFTLLELTGPPTWWMPRPLAAARSGTLELGAGWLQHAYILGWTIPPATVDTVNRVITTATRTVAVRLTRPR